MNSEQENKKLYHNSFAKIEVKQGTTDIAPLSETADRDVVQNVSAFTNLEVKEKFEVSLSPDILTHTTNEGIMQGATDIFTPYQDPVAQKSIQRIEIESIATCPSVNETFKKQAKTVNSSLLCIENFDKCPKQQRPRFMKDSATLQREYRARLSYDEAQKKKAAAAAYMREYRKRKNIFSNTSDNTSITGFLKRKRSTNSEERLGEIRAIAAQNSRDYRARRKAAKVATKATNGIFIKPPTNQNLCNEAIVNGNLGDNGSVLHLNEQDKELTENLQNTGLVKAQLKVMSQSYKYSQKQAIPMATYSILSDHCEGHSIFKDKFLDFLEYIDAKDRSGMS